jgi:hypothetical protein
MRNIIFFIFAITLAATALAGKQADRPKFKVGDHVRAKNGLQWIHGYCADIGGKVCDTTRGPEPYSGKSGVVREVLHRTCARDVGLEISSGLTGAEINEIRAGVGVEPIDAKKHDETEKRRAEELMSIDSCDDYKYSVDFWKAGNHVLYERELRNTSERKKRKG